MAGPSISPWIRPASRRHLEMLADSRLSQGRIPDDVIGDTGLVLG